MKRDYEGCIAIVGMAGRMPNSADLDAFWQALLAGESLLSKLDEKELIAAGVPEAVRRDPRYVPVASSMNDVECFDHDFFGYGLREASIIDPQQRVLLELAHEAFEHAGHVPQEVKDKVGVFLGSGYCNYLVNNLGAEIDPHDQLGGLQILMGNDKEYAATRISYKLNLTGPSVAVNSACSTSLVAVHQACRALQSYECDFALAGAAKITIPNRVGYLAQDGGISSKDGTCRPYDADGSGPVFGSGAGVVLLRRIEDALADRDVVYAVIRGSAVNNDGSSKVSFSAPSTDGQVEVIADALADAGVSAHDIAYVEGHGTSTPLGDPIEVAALSEYYRSEGVEAGHCYLGSVKANVGHLEAAAGMAGLFKTVYALREGRIPPLLNFRRPNKNIPLESTPFRINTEAIIWPEPLAACRLAAISSFGIGGTNAHMVLEAYQADEGGEAAPSWSGPYLLLLSARNETALERLRHAYIRRLESGDLPLERVSVTAACGRQHHSLRLAIVAHDRESLLTQLRRPGSTPSAACAPLRISLCDSEWNAAAFAADNSPLGVSLRSYLQSVDAIAASQFAALRSPAGSALPFSVRAQLVYAEFLRASGLPLGRIDVDAASLAAAMLATGLLNMEQAVRAKMLSLGLLEPGADAERTIDLGRVQIFGMDGRRYSTLRAPKCWRQIEAVGAVDQPMAADLVLGQGQSGVEEPARVNAALLQLLAQAYAAGVGIDWSAVYRDVPVDKIAVPTYPFAKTRCWIEPAASSVPRSASPARPPSAAEVIAHVAEFAHRDAADIGPQTQFQRDLMMESMMLAELNASLGKRFGLSEQLPLALYFEGGSVGDLIARLEQSRVNGATDPQPGREDDALAFLSRWASSSAYPEVQRIARRLVHKALDKNVLIARTESLGGDLFVAEIAQDLSHDYYYEHAQDHVPGLYLIEAARQAATAIVHLHYGAPFGSKFIMNDLSSNFESFAELNASLFLSLHFIDVLFKDGTMERARAKIRFVQNGKVIGTMQSQAVIFSAQSYNVVRDGLAVIAG